MLGKGLRLRLSPKESDVSVMTRGGHVVRTQESGLDPTGGRRVGLSILPTDTHSEMSDGHTFSTLVGQRFPPVNTTEHVSIPTTLLSYSSSRESEDGSCLRPESSTGSGDPRRHCHMVSYPVTNPLLQRNRVSTSPALQVPPPDHRSLPEERRSGYRLPTHVFLSACSPNLNEKIVRVRVLLL